MSCERSAPSTVAVRHGVCGPAGDLGLAKVLPALAGKISGHSIRVPTLNVAMVELTLLLERTPDRDSLNQWLQQQSKEEKKRGEPSVSTFHGNIAGNLRLANSSSVGIIIVLSGALLW